MGFHKNFMVYSKFWNIWCKFWFCDLDEKIVVYGEF